MIADIFYPILILTITVLGGFIRKKIVHRFYTHAFTSCRPGPSAGVTASPQTPSYNHFWLCQKPMHPYFFCMSWYPTNFCRFYYLGDVDSLQV